VANGAVLAPDARTAALRWAERRGALIVEDDYDAEYRYDRAPIGAVQGLAPDRVVYAGTASKTLAPGLRLGWLVVSADLVDDIAEAKSLVDRGSPVSTNWRLPTSSSAVSSTATCAACDRSTGGAATR
jgi:GntR family transcriptional regulator/MocR family aminotransferase